jgi:hypothetical protein
MTQRRLRGEFGIDVSIEELKSFAFEDILSRAGPATLTRQHGEQERHPRTTRMILGWGHLKHRAVDRREMETLEADQPVPLDKRPIDEPALADDVVTSLLEELDDPGDIQVVQAMYELMQKPDAPPKLTNKMIAERLGRHPDTVRKRLKKLRDRLAPSL